MCFVFMVIIVEINHIGGTDINNFPLLSCRAELSEVVRSRDAWANHTTLQSSALQLLQREISHLKEGRDYDLLMYYTF